MALRWITLVLVAVIECILLQTSLIEAVLQTPLVNNEVIQSSKGNEFILGFMKRHSSDSDEKIILAITTDEQDPVSFTVEYLGKEESKEAVRGQITEVSLEEDVRVTDRTDDRDKAVRIKADGTKLLTVFGFDFARVSSDGFLALPIHRYPVTTYRYLILSTDLSASPRDYLSEFLIVGYENDTEITLKPRKGLIIEVPTNLISGETINTALDLTPVEGPDSKKLSLNSLNTALFSAPLHEDLSGTIIEANKPISVFVGHECGEVPVGERTCDFLVEQIPPDATWGTHFFTVPFDFRDSGEHYKIGTIADDNQVIVTCTTEGNMSRQVKNVTIQSQEFVDFDTFNNDTSTMVDVKRDFCCIETTKPAIVMMYMNGHGLNQKISTTGSEGDPSMVYVPPVSQYYTDEYQFSTESSTLANFDSYISYAFPIQFFDNSLSDQSAFVINGSTFAPTSGYHPIYCSNGQICGYGAYSKLLTRSFQVVGYTKPLAPLYLYVYGYKDEESYAQPAGFLMQPVGVPQIAIYNVTVLENVGNLTIRLNRTGGDLSLRSVIRATSRDITATAGTDYFAKSDFRIRWFENDVDPRYISEPSENDQVFQFTIIDDEIEESLVEYFEIDFVLNPSGNGRNGVFVPQAVGRVTILDNDGDGVLIGFDPTAYSVLEGEVAMLRIVLNRPYTEDVTVTVETNDGNATDQLDYNGVSMDVTIPAGLTEILVNVETLEDDESESLEYFRATLSNARPSDRVGINQPNATVSITNRELQAVTVSFERPTYTVGEKDGAVNICILTSNGHADRYVNVTVEAQSSSECGDNPTATAVNDFNAGGELYLLSFPPSSTGNKLCFDVTIISDVIIEGNEQFVVKFLNVPDEANRVDVGEISQACVTITDDVAEFKFKQMNVTVNETDKYATICVGVDRILEPGRNIMIVVTAQTRFKADAVNAATVDFDYENTTLMFTFEPSDDIPLCKCANVTIIDDSLGNEPDEQFSVSFVSIEPLGMFDPTSEACVTITDKEKPKAKWKEPEITVNEGEERQICFVVDSGSAVPYEVEVGVRGKGALPATDTDYIILSPLTFNISAMLSGGCYCLNMSIIDDSLDENTEQFELYFANLDSDYATAGDPDVACVNIVEKIPPSDFTTCKITEPQRVQTFTKTTEYGFLGTCEHVAVSPCLPIAGFDVQVTVDFLTETMDNGAVGLHVNDLRYVSREDGSFDDGSQTPQSSTSTHREYLLDSGVEVIVDFGLGVTNITFYTGTDISGDSFDLDIQIVHIYDPPAGEDSSIQIGVRTSNSSEIENLCGLCGSRSGDLLKRDGSIADRNDLAQVQEFAQSYLVEPREQILRPQRKECGTIRNDTVIGDPLYAAPVYSEDGKEYSLCYEVYGRTNSIFNLVSDTCVSVNAHYGPMRNHTEGNIINSIGVRAKGLADNSCHNIRVDLTGCSATVQTSSGESHSLASMESFEQDGISVRKYPRRVRISTPNCENVMLVMWVICETRNDEDMIKFVIARGVNLRASSHGLLGQFWNIPLSFTKYNSSLIPETDRHRNKYYVVTVDPSNESSPSRSFLGTLYHLKWDKSRAPCLYAGNAQGGPSRTHNTFDPADSVIEGRYQDYIISGGNLFETHYTYSQFDSSRC